MKTRDSGYAERKLVKRMDDMTVHLDHTIRNSINNIIGFSYGDSLDPTMIYNNNGPSFADIDAIVDSLNAEIPDIPDEDDGEATDILLASRSTERKKELELSIKEYRTTIKNLKLKKGAVYKRLLKSAQQKLKELKKVSVDLK